MARPLLVPLAQAHPFPPSNTSKDFDCPGTKVKGEEMCKETLTSHRRWVVQPLGGVQGRVPHHTFVDGLVVFQGGTEFQVAGEC